MRGWWFRERGKQGNGTLFNVKPCPFSDPFPFPGTRSTDSGHMNFGHMIAPLESHGIAPTNQTSLHASGTVAVQAQHPWVRDHLTTRSVLRPD